jgi:uncharacterized membrane protein
MLYQIMVFIHLLSAVTWVGGMLFLVMVMVPLARCSIEPPSLGTRILGQLAGSSVLLPGLL